MVSAVPVNQKADNKYTDNYSMSERMRTNFGVPQWSILRIHSYNMFKIIVVLNIKL